MVMLCCSRCRRAQVLTVIVRCVHHVIILGNKTSYTNICGQDCDPHCLAIYTVTAISSIQCSACMLMWRRKTNLQCVAEGSLLLLIMQCQDCISAWAILPHHTRPTTPSERCHFHLLKCSVRTPLTCILQPISSMAHSFHLHQQSDHGVHQRTTSGGGQNRSKHINGDAQ